MIAPAIALADSELRHVVAAWPVLPEPIRRAVLALVGTVTNVTGTETPLDGHDNGGFGDGGAEGGRSGGWP